MHPGRNGSLTSVFGGAFRWLSCQEGREVLPAADPLSAGGRRYEGEGKLFLQRRAGIGCFAGLFTILQLFVEQVFPFPGFEPLTCRSAIRSVAH